MTRLPFALFLAALPVAAAAQDAQAPDAQTPAAATEAAPAAAEGAQGMPVAAPPSITVSAVTTQRLVDRVIASGLVDAVEEVSVQPLVEGQPVDALLADVGDVVEQGQVLARLGTATLDLQVSQLAANRAAAEAAVAQAEASRSQAEANATEAERQAARDAQLAEAGTVPRAQADQSQAAAESARAAVNVAEQGIAAARAQIELVDAQIANARLQLQRTEVAAPVAGLIVARNAQVGAVASASGAAMFTIARDGAMELRAEVSEGDFLKLRPGQRARLTAVEGGAPIAGTVRRVDPTIDPQTRLGTARIQIDDPGQVVQGMFLQADVTVEEADTLAVPVTAVGQDGDSQTVMRLDGDRVQSATVQTGIRDGGLIAVTSGLAEGDLVVTRAGAFVRDGDRITPVREDAADAAADAGSAVADAAPAATQPEATSTDATSADGGTAAAPAQPDAQPAAQATAATPAAAPATDTASDAPAASDAAAPAQGD